MASLNPLNSLLRHWRYFNRQSSRLPILRKASLHTWDTSTSV